MNIHNFTKGAVGHISLILDNTLKAQIDHILPYSQAKKALGELQQENLKKEHFVVTSNPDEKGWFDAIIVSDKYTWSGRLCPKEQPDPGM